MNHSREIYQEVIRKVEKVISTLESEGTDSEIIEYQNQARNKLSALYQTLVDNLQSLEKNSEWNVFTIAFYGETNAGKSTLIETLRILLKEKTKLQERMTFDKALHDYKQVQFKINDLNTIIKSLENSYENELMIKQDILNGLLLRKTDLESSLEILESRLNELHYDILHKIVFRSFDFIRSMFNKLDEQTEIDNIVLEINDVGEKMKSLEEEIIKRQDDLDETDEKYDSDKKSRMKEAALLQNTIAELEQILTNNSDAKIVGDGRSDFTRNVTEYRFAFNNQTFVISDLPGIEGNEKSVQAEIDGAIEKAHAVFYISGKANPPQKGNDERTGTIAKIKNHLEKHSEVYFIYNKRVNNPRQLSKTLITDSESESLNVVDRVMAETLGKQYNHHLSLSGYPALVSIGNYWGGRLEKSKYKFLDTFDSPKVIMTYSGVKTFSDWMTTNLVENINFKIEKANVNKVSFSLNDTINNLGELSDSFNRLEHKLKSTLKGSSDQLEEVEELFYRNVINSMNGAINKFKQSLRKKMYSDIDQDINNDQFSNRLKQRTEEEVERLIKDFEKRIHKNVEDFEGHMSAVIEKNQQYVEELLESYSNSVEFTFEFDPEIKMKKSVNPAEVAASAGGLIYGVIFNVMNLTNPFGWALLAISVITLIVFASKTIYKVLNSDYRKSQQKKSTDENIQEIANKLRASLEEEVDKTVTPVNNAVNRIVKDIETSVSQVEVMRQVFEDVESELRVMARDIEYREELINGNN